MVKDAMLPEAFAELERFAPIWALPTVKARYHRRWNATMEELQAFYDAMLPRAEEAMSYLDQFTLDDMPDPALHLMWMLGSLSAVGFSVDCLRQPTVPDARIESLEFIEETTP